MTSTVMSCSIEASGAILYSFCMSTKLKQQSTLQMRKEAQEKKKIISGNSTIALNKTINEIENKFLGLLLLQLISRERVPLNLYQKLFFLRGYIV